MMHGDVVDNDDVGGPGVSSYDISLEKQEVVVKGSIPYDDLHAKIAKTGKQVRRARYVAGRERCI